MKKKGFTLIELLAVIVILAIIALIATPMVLNTIDDARKGSASSSAYTYMSEVETTLAKYMLKNGGTSYSAGKHTVAELQTDLGVEVKGDTPSEGNVCIGSDGTVTSASIKINGYVVSYDRKNATTTDLDEVEDITCDENAVPETPEVAQVELKDASDAIKTANNYVGEAENLSTSAAYITVSINGTNEGHLTVDQILYFPTELSVVAPISSAPTYVYSAGYYKVTQEVSLPSYMNFMVIASGGSQYGCIEYLGESYLVNAE